MKLIASNGAQYLLNRAEVRIGRSSSANDIVLNDPTVSSQHAVIRLDGPMAFITDVGSSNGTYVNNRPIGGSAYQIQPGDQIQLGNVVLQVVDEYAVSGLRPEAARPGPVSPGWATQQPPPSVQAYPAQLPVPAAQPYGYHVPAPKDRIMAVGMEVVGGLFGFLGVGWIYAGQTGVGVTLMLGYWLFICVQAGIAMMSMAASLLCTVPVTLTIIGISAYMLYNHTRSHPEEFGG